MPVNPIRREISIFRRHEAYSPRQEKFYFRWLLFLVQALFWAILNGYLRWFGVRHVNDGALREIRRAGKPCVFAAWHGDMYFCSAIVRGWGMDVMASRSNFGSIAAAMLRASGNRPVRGGSRKGGKEALEMMLETLAAGGCAAIIADAPRGPWHESKVGPLLAAARSGSPIVAVAIGARRAWTLPGWDRGWIPKPFSPVVAVWSDPIHIPSDLDRQGLESARVALTDSMNALSRRVQALLGSGSA